MILKNVSTYTYRCIPTQKKPLDESFLYNFRRHCANAPPPLILRNKNNHNNSKYIKNVAVKGWCTLIFFQRFNSSLNSLHIKGLFTKYTNSYFKHYRAVCTHLYFKICANIGV